MKREGNESEESEIREENERGMRNESKEGEIREGNEENEK